MEQHNVKVRSIEYITHDVLRIVTEKPVGYTFIPGQATEIAISKEGWKNKKRPFTFTCLPQHNYLEFFIKTYPSHKGVTNELRQLKQNDELILHDVFGTIAYKSEGVFIAGGAGITPFICILRDLQSENKIGNNKLILANKTLGDIILAEEFKTLLGKNFINILSDEKVDGYSPGQISESFLKDYVKDSPKNIYLCGPPPMMDAVERFLSNLHFGKKLIIKEAF
ncbi:MAG: flavodoxin reductase [Bacteroidetes bacterium HGW-Bacteroidetes-22]|nr:MAG: flavodoxin reductase [Bacteroidetes bacterium HGW-Bacteroidetes-22]